MGGGGPGHGDSGGGGGGDDFTGHKSHRKPQKGRKADKKDKDKKKLQEGVDPRIRNPKAFAINSAVRAERKFRRAQDLETKKDRVPLVDRTPVEIPPFVVAIVGPPKVGKSTLFINLVKNYTRQTLSDIKGPVTIVTGKKRRLTIIECNNDINSMIDVAKVADLVLLLVDASFGFEMEVFEFLNICQVHGFPQIMGVLTHLDQFRNKKKLKKTKKTLKHRFWTEVYPGAKLFYLSGYFPMTNSYPKNEVHNLARFISVMKFRPTVWRSEHAYVVADRMEDLTSLEHVRVNSKVDRRISLYGWVHGTFLKQHVSVHIPGLGDFTPDAISALPDPCPLPLKERTLRRNLNEKEKVMYAPFSGVGGIVYDQDAVYIDLGGSHSHHKSHQNDDGSENPDSNKHSLVGELRDLKTTLDEKMESAGLQLFSESAPMTAAEVEEDDRNSDSEDEGMDLDGNDGDEEEDTRKKFTSVVTTDGRVRRKVLFAEGNEEDDENISQNVSEDDDESDEEMEAEEDDEVKTLKSKKDRYLLAEEAFYSRFKHRSIQKMIYDDTDDYMNITSKADFDSANYNDLPTQEKAAVDSDDEDNEDMKNLFIGGDYAETAKNLLDAEGDSDDAFGDFEELDDDEDEGSSKKQKKDLKESNDEPADEGSAQKNREDLKKKLKEKFDMDYDDGGDEKSFYRDWKAQVEEQTKINRTYFDDVDDPNLLRDLQGLAPGSYVRIEISRVPCEFVINFDPQRCSPLVVGSLDSSNQETLSVVQARVKKHRWHPKILKTRDPIIMSVGWRRFQTIALYSVQDHNKRNRMIKYTPDHLHCVANFYGPMTPQGTGILGIAPSGFEGFRITMTGTILDMDKSTELVKKLKLVGTPAKIFKKSAFIEGMFSSQLEVAKFIGAKIKTVSGIRGVVKKELRTPAGAFRATFEDKIQQSDIVFCRTWAKVDVPSFYLNLPNLITQQPRLMKTVGQLKREREIQIEPNPDNLYTPIERQQKNFRPLKIPKKLQEKLPYKDKPKVLAKLHEPKRIAVIKDPHERQMTTFLRTLKTRMTEKEAKEKADKAKKAAEREKVMKKVEERQTQRQKELRKKVFRHLGLINKNGENPSGGGGGRSGRGGRGGRGGGSGRGGRSRPPKHMRK